MLAGMLVGMSVRMPADMATGMAGLPMGEVGRRIRTAAAQKLAGTSAGFARDHASMRHHEHHHF